MLLQDVARALLISTSKLSRLEKGHGAPLERDVRDLLRYYDQQDTELGHRMWRWAEEGRETPWWHGPGVTAPPVIDRYLQYETGAAEISGYVIHFVPTLLQTAAYARALRTALDGDDVEEVEQHVRLVLRRQEVVTRPDYPVKLDVVIDESVFHRMVGSPEIMREQLSSLADAAQRPNVVLRVLRFSAGPHPAIAEGVFTVFHFRDEVVADIVNIEGRVTDAYVESTAGITIYRDLLAGLRDIALDPASSTEFIKQMAASY